MAKPQMTLRLNPEYKRLAEEAAKMDGEERLATWIKNLISRRIRELELHPNPPQ